MPVLTFTYLGALQVQGVTAEPQSPRQPLRDRVVVIHRGGSRNGGVRSARRDIP
ncbi:hypothetical protein [Pseudomonas amygdali]|uniref:hypothetical protein n=1 Tax=Pseudomonas amygdali TaxID=47877 RepID=UPI001FB7C69B|nr:hypothetical protein [Pseudomonas amygdali]UPT36240.1 hypothetical protein LT107_23140 [Pseudomonas amygdali pv. loropetali]